MIVAPARFLLIQNCLEHGRFCQVLFLSGMVAMILLRTLHRFLAPEKMLKLERQAVLLLLLCFVVLLSGWMWLVKCL